jgi:hypothetical protein
MMIEVSDIGNFDAAFGDVGLKVGPRTGEAKRTQAEKEWYVVRRFLASGLHAGLFNAPFAVERLDPPAPDFGLRFRDGSAAGFIEVTEATHPDDQREMTEMERSGEAALLGEHGGRFADGASQPGWEWASDILDAIRRKQKKAIYRLSDAGRHLVIYPNSNASFLIFNPRGERKAFVILFNSIGSQRQQLVDLVNGCAVHVLGKDHLCFDVLGDRKLVPRE